MLAQPTTKKHIQCAQVQRFLTSDRCSLSAIQLIRMLHEIFLGRPFSRPLL
jgi:hypothetical protein